MMNILYFEKKDLRVNLQVKIGSKSLTQIIKSKIFAIIK